MNLDRFADLFDAPELLLGPGDLLDAIWLASQGLDLSSAMPLVPGAFPSPPPRPPVPGDGDGDGDGDGGGGGGKKEQGRHTEGEAIRTESQQLLYSGAMSSGGDRTVSASAVATPAARALPNHGEILRALKPLRQRWPSKIDSELDEEATAQLSADLGGADDGRLYPVFRPRLERWFECDLVVEDDDAVGIWDDRLRAFVQTLRNSGAFREVRSWRLRLDPDDPDKLARARLETPAGGLVPVGRLGGGIRRVILFASHGASGHWADAIYPRLLTGWSAQSALALLHLLPKDMWIRTVLGQAQGRCSTSRPGVSGEGLDVDPFWWMPGPDPDSPQTLRLPVFELEPGPVADWAGMLMARGRSAPLFLIEPAAARRSASLRADNGEAVGRRVDALREAAAEAFWLAVVLSRAPFTIPVALLIQEAKYGEVNNRRLAELFLSGLIRTVAPASAAPVGEDVWYEVVEAARPLLLRSMYASEGAELAQEVFERVSRHIAAITGRAVTKRSFTPDPNGRFDIPGWAKPFARMAASLRMSGGSGGGKTHEDPAPLKEAVTAEELRGLVRIKTSDGFFPHAIGSITREKLVAAGWADDGALSDALDELARLEPLLRLEILWVGDHGRSRLANDFRASGALVDHVSDGDQVIALLGERSLANLIICDLDNEDDERVTLDLLERVGDLERAPAVIGYATQFAQGRAQRMKAAGAIACSRSESALEKAVIAFALREPLPLDPDDTAGETAGTVGGKEAKTGGQSMTRAPLAQVLPPRELRRLAALRRARAMPGPETFGAETWAKLTAAGWKIDYYLEEALEDLAEHSPMIGFRILWVDDNPSNNAGSVAAFRNMGAEVVEVLDTDAALARLAEGYPADLVISDMGRAGFDQAGFELLERLKSFTSPPPVIIYAGWFARDATRRRQARTAGAIACLRNNRELIDAVLALAAGHGVPADPEDASAEVSGTGPEDARATHPAASESQESITKSFYHAEHSGIEALQHGDAAGATKAYTAMLAAAERLDDPSLRAAAHLRLGEAARIRNRDDEVEQHYRAALEEALRTPDMSRVAEIYILLGESHEARGDLAAAVETYRKALDYERESPQAFIAFSKLGRATRALGDLEEAGRLWELALEIAQSQEILPDVLQTLRSLAALSEQKRDVERASYFWEQALVASRGDVNETRALLDYAQFAKRFGQYDQARHRFEIGLKRAKSESDDVLVAESAIGLAETAFEAGALDESEDRYREALHTLHKTLDKEWQAEILFRLGLIASRQNRLEEGKSSLAEALALAPHDSGEVIANCHLELGRLDLKRRDTAPARKHLESALHRFEELGDQRMAAYASYDLWRLDTSIGAHRQAREHLVKAHGIMDRLGDPDTAARWRAELEPAPAQPSRPSSSTTALQLITDVCLRLIQQFEGFGKKRPDGSAEAYPDPGTGGDPWTIGWGTTGPDVKKGVVWTQAQCDSRFRSDLERFAKKVLDLVGNAPTTQNQFDALLSFAYNVGPQNLSSSTLLKKHKAGDYRGAATEFTKWNKAAGKTLPGLVRRRAAEAELYSAAGPTTN